MKLYNIFVLLAILVLATESHPAQAAEISGAVQDGEAGTLLIGAVLRIPGTRLGTMTDANGQFTLKVTESGTYQIVFDEFIVL